MCECSKHSSSPLGQLRAEARGPAGQIRLRQPLTILLSLPNSGTTWIMSVTTSASEGKEKSPMRGRLKQKIWDDALIRSNKQGEYCTKTSRHRQRTLKATAKAKQGSRCHETALERGFWDCRASGLNRFASSFAHLTELVERMAVEEQWQC